MVPSWEIALLTALVLGTIKLLYEFRSIPWIGASLSALVAVVLIYPAYAHAQWRKAGIRFFEPDGKSVLRSLQVFGLLALCVFPPFLLANHFYQQAVFHARFRPGALPIGLAAALTQVFLVALPEEFFFRGYLQTLLTRRFGGASFRFLGIRALTMSWGVPATALVFAFAHSFITFQWWHFAIFFPALAFGWLREKTDGLVAPVLFHALSNVIVNSIGAWYR